MRVPAEIPLDDRDVLARGTLDGDELGPDAVLPERGEEERLVLPPQEAGGDDAAAEVGEGMDEVGAFSGGLDADDAAANHAAPSTLLRAALSSIEWAAGGETADFQRAVYRRMQADYDEARSLRFMP